VFRGSVEFSSDSSFFAAVGENIGAVIMPWMIYFQQTAVVARGLTTKDLKSERASTASGCFLTQFIMIATMITMAAATGGRGNFSVDSIQDIVDGLVPHLGELASKVLVSFAFVGGSLSAGFVVSMAACWSLCEATGETDKEVLSLNVPIRKAKLFYSSFVIVVGIGVAIVVSGVDLVALMEAVVVMDSFLMPFTVGFLYLLSTSDELPEEARVKGCSKVILALVFSIVSVVCIGSTIFGFVPEPEHSE